MGSRSKVNLRKFAPLLTWPPMLPDLPTLKSKLREAYLGYVSKRAHAQIGIFNEVPKHIVHEGESMRMLRPDGASDDTDMMRATAEFSIRESETASLTFPRESSLHGSYNKPAARPS